MSMTPTQAMRRLVARMTAAAGSGAASSTTAAAAGLGAMPEWNLSDLYAGTTSDALTSDIAKAVESAVAFKARYQGKLAGLAAGGGGAALVGCVRDYEALEDLLGRLAS